jgi:acyl-CoA reductase-like NAD-dependent aldehyde dehydrogenase
VSPPPTGVRAGRYETAWVDADPYPQVIDGRESRRGQVFPVLDPSTGDTVATWAEASAAEVDEAVAAARRSFDAGMWSRAPEARRAEVLDAAAVTIRDQSRRLATLESLDTGKAISGALHFDLYEAASAFASAAGTCRDLHGDVRRTSFPPELFPAGGPELLTMRLREPAGVVCELLPWNAPLMTGSQRIAAALAAGCSLVVKAPEEAVVSIVNLSRLLGDAGLPPGVLNVVLGRGETVGEQLVRDPRFDLVSLTGSVATGKRVMELASANLTAVHLELGGKAPVIIFADAELEGAIHWATMAAFVNSGQVCVAGSRVLVEEAVYHDVVSEIVRSSSALPIGDALDPATFFGPLISQQHADRVRGFVDRATRAGDAEIAGQGSTPAGGPGTFVAPTVLANVRRGSEIEQDEVFGPVLATLPFTSEDDAVDIANGTTYGLNASVFTTNIERAFGLAQRLQCGEVNINCHFTPDMNHAKGDPRKMSGLAGVDVHAYTRLKGVNVKVGS